MTQRLFPEKSESQPKIYAYQDLYNPHLKGLLKVGYTTQDTITRIHQQHNIVKPGGDPIRIVFEESAMRQDGTVFTDKDVQRMLVRKGCPQIEGEWHRCEVEDVRKAWVAVRDRKETLYDRTETFPMRPEQQEAVNKTAAYFERYSQEKDHTPHFLWNCKMRFGKTFTTYQLALRMKWHRLLVLTFKPAVAQAWEEDLMRHQDFEGWQFINSKTQTDADIDAGKPFVCFGSFQDFLGKSKSGGIKAKHEWTRAFNWDCVVLDEYHFGAWREEAQELIGSREDLKEQKQDLKGQRLDLKSIRKLQKEADKELSQELENPEYFDEDLMPITARHYLYLSGTPFRALASGDFIEDEIYNWTYSDEQRAKENWEKEHPMGALSSKDHPANSSISKAHPSDNHPMAASNPYTSLPRMVLMTYQLPPAIASVASDGEFDEFDLNTFFLADSEGDEACFRYHDDVQKWLDLLRGNYLPSSIDNLKQNNRKPPLPFFDSRLYGVLAHTLWFLPNVAACYAMRNLLSEPQNSFYQDYQVIVCAGTKAGIGLDALHPVELAMQHPDPLHCKTITLSCGKLTTGVTVKPWTGIFMLRDTSSPETYFQAAFRVQSPWTIANRDGLHPNQVEILKQECYVFDFSPNRALRKLAEYSSQLNVDEHKTPEEKVDDLLHFLPVLCYQDGSMKMLNAGEVLDMATSNTSATLLARRWESATLVNVTNGILEKLLNNEQAMNALMSIEGFRSLNEDIQTIINKTDHIKKTKKEVAESGEELSKKEKKELTEEEKEIKSKRKMIQEKLIKFATRIPIFMYLTDYRERSLRDVIMQLEPGLFAKVTGLSKKDFELLVNLGVFNEALMNDAVFKFKRYEDSSLTYAGINRHEEEEKVGLWSTAITREELFSE